VFGLSVRLVRNVTPNAARSRALGLLRLAGTGLALVGLSQILAVPMAFGQTYYSGPAVSATIPVAVRSLTVSPTSVTFGTCLVGTLSSTGLAFPNGLCTAPTAASDTVSNINVSNTGAPASVLVEVTNVVTGGVNWSPVSSTPGQDQFEMDNGAATTPFALTPVCDGYFTANMASGTNSAVSGSTCPVEVSSSASSLETLRLTGPSATTTQGTSFSTTVTWLAS
jgi:hypothetical protein